MKVSEPKRRVGRPSTYTEKVAAALCQLLAEGQSLKKATSRAGMPAYRTVMQWLGTHPEFAQRYARAMELRAERWAEEIVEVADTEKNPHRARVRVDARKWVAAKLLPKKYGERVELTGKLTIEELILEAAGAGEADAG